MKISLVSDLHLEFATIKLPETGANVLLLAGDIVPIAYLQEKRTDAESRKIQHRVEYFIQESLAQYKTVFHIMGNHEYYKGMWDTAPIEFAEYWNKKAPQVKLLYRESVELTEGLRLWAGTLWTSFSNGHPLEMIAAKRGINDYHLINKFNPNPSPYGRRTFLLSPEDTYEAHRSSVRDLEEELRNFGESRWIVMSHHAPSWRSVAQKFAGDPLNSAYASDLDPFIEEHPNIHTWVHGHTHTSHDYTIGTTRVLCNPRGYAHPNTPNKPENETFNPGLVFEV